MMTEEPLPSRRAELHDELELARAALRDLVGRTDAAGLARLSDGTRWTNRQLLFHMMFGYLIVRRLRPLVRLFGRLPDRASVVFAAVLNAGTRPFHLVNFLGSAGGGRVLSPARTVAWMDRTVEVLGRCLDRDSDAELARTMHFPTAWDPYFRETMSLADVYHYATQHFEHHRAQLTLDR